MAKKKRQTRNRHKKVSLFPECSMVWVVYSGVCIPKRVEYQGPIECGNPLEVKHRVQMSNHDFQCYTGRNLYGSLAEAVAAVRKRLRDELDENTSERLDLEDEKQGIETELETLKDFEKNNS